MTINRLSKRGVRDLAVFGGKPAFSEPLYVGRPNIGDRQTLFARINDALSRKTLSNHGPLEQELEARVRDLLNVKHCVLTCNGTVALEIGIRALGLSGEVIVPSFTFIATAHALQWQGITPVFCDVNRYTHNLAPSEVERLITPRTSGVLGVHVWGRPCAMEALDEIARRHNLRLLFDAAHAFACSHGESMIGNFGSLEVFSFHATKFFNTFEGGAITTNDDDIAARARLMTNFGFGGPDRVVCLGTNGKMSEVSAAMGLTGLDAIDDVIALNHHNHEHYQAELSGIPGVTLVSFDARNRSNYQWIVAEIDVSAAGISRNQLLEVLRAENVFARRYFYPGCHRSEPYKNRPEVAVSPLPVTDAIADCVLTLPNGTAVGDHEIQIVSEVIRLAILGHAEVSGRLPKSA